MDIPLHGQHTLADGSATADPTAVIPPQTSSSRTTLKRKIKKKKQTVVSDSASLDCRSNCTSAASYSLKGIKIARNPKRFRVGSLPAARKNVGLSDVDALGLPLGMSIAAVVAQVLKRKNAAPEKMSVHYLSEICGLAVRESLGNVFGDRFDNFVMNFETSFRSTLMTLQLISRSCEADDEQLQIARECSCSVTSNTISGNTLKEESACPPEATEQESCTHTNITKQQQSDGCRDSAFEAISLSSYYRIGDPTCLSSYKDGPVPFPDKTSTNRQCHTNSGMEENVLTSQQLVVPDKQITCTSPSNQFSTLSTIEKSVMEQTRSNDLKTFEIGLIMKKMQLKERELELNSTANILKRWKLSMGISKASFKAEKFKTQLQDSREVELLKKCLDFLVGGLIIMMFSLAYGTYVYSHRRIVEATETCSPYMESSKSWWMPKSMSSFNSGLQLLKCQIQVFTRMLFGAVMIGAVAFLLIQRSASSHQTMPVTFIVLLLGVVCGSAGKFCIDTLGGSGNHWLMYWEMLCLLHFFSNIFHSTLFAILNGPILVAETVNHNVVFPYWMRKSLFYAALLVLPLLCGFMPFASPWDWFIHFSTLETDFDD